METKNSKPNQGGKLQATIGIITRGGPFKINTYQSTNPVLLKGMKLPAEADYEFLNPMADQGYVNLPVSIELFFGENGREQDDISLGKFQLNDVLSVHAGQRKIELRLVVNVDQTLMVEILDHTSMHYRNICFIDLFGLEPPKTLPVSKTSAADSNKLMYEQFSNLFTNPQPREKGVPRRGKDILQEIVISFEEALNGIKKDIEIDSAETCPQCTGSGIQSGKTFSYCPDCQGTGWKKEVKQTNEGPEWRGTNCQTCNGDGVIITDPCSNCQGNGWVKIKRRKLLNIPAYIDSGAEVCILHKGEPGRYGGLPGHLRFIVNVSENPIFTRLGHDIFIHMPVNTNFAKEGGYLCIPNPKTGNSFLIKLPAETQNEMRYRVFDNNKHSLIAVIEIYLPILLFALPNVKKKIQRIKETLGNTDYQLAIPPNGIRPSQALLLDMRLEKEHRQIGLKPQTQAEFYTRRGMMYVEKKNREHALFDFNKAIELDPGYASAYDNRSSLFMGKNESDKVLADLNKAVELDPTNAEFHFHRGMFYHFQNDLVNALANYNKALDLNPSNSDYYESRGKLHLLQNDKDAAISDFSKVLELEPNNADIHHKRGVLHQNQGNSKKALKDFNKALELEPDNDSYLSDRSQFYVFQKDFDNALTDADKIVERNPKNARAYNNRGYIYWLQNKLDTALADYNKALELDPKLVPSYNYRGQVYLKQKQFKQAMEDFNRSLSLDPQDMWPCFWLGQAYQGLGETDQAVSLFKKVLKISQNSLLLKEAEKQVDNLGN